MWDSLYFPFSLVWYQQKIFLGVLFLTKVLGREVGGYSWYTYYGKSLDGGSFLGIKTIEEGGLFITYPPGCEKVGLGVILGISKLIVYTQEVRGRAQGGFCSYHPGHERSDRISSS